MEIKTRQKKGVRFHQAGGPEVLKVEHVDVPAPGPQEVRLQVKAIGLNRIDSFFRSGYFSEQPIFPSLLGFEASGVIESVGDQVKDFAPGDVVSVIAKFSNHDYGTYGDLIILPAASLEKHPSNLTFEEAAALWVSYLAAYGMLVDSANLKPGQYVLYNAASSNTGHAITQTIKLLGGIPIALTSTPSKKRAISDLGVQHIIVTTEQHISEEVLKITNGKGADVILDAVGGKQFELLINAAANYAKVFAYGALDLEPGPWPMLGVVLKKISITGYDMTDTLMDAKKINAAIAFVKTGVQHEKLKPVIGPKFSLTEVVEAHRTLERNQHIGKIVLIPEGV
ncbi:zinc-dependent alcohol dehydrogenase family protein [Chitinophaga pinensis]|uniref:Alcohol dehydrogenase zinc-binding domain protein n=1 Tax=Chitinophaga pinensis (strain ATCC 43595 / DSM 2588 / LMG 13176 / NBRC 15968 / NCIMB 11800 / UQM 2034) TaxID=485918 RepID=A0A979G9I5_CHIPD|nr:zinc-dependent alcohol dehydrogenase family protein [Chitinophaga pinensis]ACU63404.1 Alcohol dehydrogenase zinc-binding domain protein [Chitinophaga pinensis DSM 2588]